MAGCWRQGESRCWSLSLPSKLAPILPKEHGWTLATRCKVAVIATGNKNNNDKTNWTRTLEQFALLICINPVAHKAPSTHEVLVAQYMLAWRVAALARSTTSAIGQAG